MTIELRRVHDVIGRRSQAPTFLVDRVWPRGVAKADLDIDAWLRDIAPSTDLRKWYNHNPDRWAEFRKRYLAELADNSDAAEPLLDAARNDDVVLLFAAKDTERNQAVVIREWLQRHKL